MPASGFEWSCFGFPCREATSEGSPSGLPCRQAIPRETPFGFPCRQAIPSEAPFGFLCRQAILKRVRLAFACRQANSDPGRSYSPCTKQTQALATRILFGAEFQLRKRQRGPRIATVFSSEPDRSNLSVSCSGVLIGTSGLSWARPRIVRAAAELTRPADRRLRAQTIAVVHLLRHALVACRYCRFRWVKLGILPERIEPGCPEQNGRHEGMH